jgi:hypothetical protein
MLALGRQLLKTEANSWLAGKEAHLPVRRIEGVVQADRDKALLCKGSKGSPGSALDPLWPAKECGAAWLRQIHMHAPLLAGPRTVPRFRLFRYGVCPRSSRSSWCWCVLALGRVG